MRLQATARWRLCFKADVTGAGSVICDVGLHDDAMLRLITFLCLAALASGCGSPTDKFAAVVQGIQSGQLSAPTNGIFRLPQSLAGLTPKGDVFVERRSDGGLFVLFPTWYGRGSDLEGFLYCTRELEPSDYYSIDWGAGGKGQHIDIAGRDMLTVQDYRAHWYRVTRRLD
jgi:hypothetical protein